MAAVSRRSKCEPHRHILWASTRQLAYLWLERLAARWAQSGSVLDPQLQQLVLPTGDVIDSMSVHRAVGLRRPVYAALWYSKKSVPLALATMLIDGGFARELWASPGAMRRYRRPWKVGEGAVYGAGYMEL